MWFKQVTHSSCPDATSMASSWHLPRLLAVQRKCKELRGSVAGGRDCMSRETSLQCKVGPGTLWGGGAVTQSLTVCGVVKAVIAAVQANDSQGERGAVHR